MKKINAFDISCIILAILGCFVVLFPFVPLILASFTGSLFWGSIKPNGFTLERYFKVISLMGYSYVNSAIASIVAVLINLAICAPAAYAFSRFRFKYKNILQNLVLAAYAVPLVAGFVPLFILFRWYGLINTIFALSIFGATMSIPLNVWFAIQYLTRYQRR